MPDNQLYKYLRLLYNWGSNTAKREIKMRKRTEELKLVLSKYEKEMLETDSNQLGLSMTSFLRMLITTWHKSKGEKIKELCQK